MEKAMPGSYNRCIFVGNLTRDPELRKTSTGSSVCKFTIAVSRKIKGKDETQFIDIVAWEKLAETCGEYLTKGASVLVEGRLVIRSYDDKDGNKRKATEIVIDVMQMLDRKGATEGANGSNASSSRAGYSRSTGGYGGDPDEDIIPF
jgi:single-strand DNA-binding protein